MSATKMARNLFFVLIGLTVGNYLYQYTSATGDWLTAIDRSLFQGVALLCAFLQLIWVRS